MATAHRPIPAASDRETLLMRYSRAVTHAGFAIDLPQIYLPHYLKWSIWRKRHALPVPSAPAGTRP